MNTNTTNYRLFAARIAVSVALSATIPAYASQLNTSLVNSPNSAAQNMQIAYGNGSSAGADRGKGRASYVDFSGTPLNTEGMRGKEGMQGEVGPAGAKKTLPDMNQAYEDLSGTHAAPAAEKAGVKGPRGSEGETGKAGKTVGERSHFNFNGDVPDGCSRYLRCNGD
jgi:hypothetical protein